MGRPRHDLGQWGKVTVTGYVYDSQGKKQRIPAGARKADIWEARARIRDNDGVSRQVQGSGASKHAAERALADKLRNRVAPAGTQASIKATSTVADVARLWLADLEDAELAISTRQVYRTMCNRHVIGLEGKPSSLANLMVREVTVGGVERFLAEIAKGPSGRGAARTARTVLRGVLDLAMKNDAIPYNPVHSAGPVKVRSTKPQSPREAERSFTAVQRDAVVAYADADAVARRRDLPDLIAFLAGTGARIGEACALRWSGVDLATGEVTLGPVVVRETGTGLHIQEDGKTETSTRTIPLPADVLARLMARQVNDPGNEWDAVFPSPRGRLRDPSNTSHDVGDLLDAAGHPWATSHTFRHTVCTLLGQAGWSWREIANYVGHKKASMTMDVYASRQTVSEGMAAALVIGAEVAAVSA